MLPRFSLQTTQSVFERGCLRRVTIEAEDDYAVLLLRGLSKSYAIPWSTLYRFAEAQEEERELRAKKARLGL